jgi:hypothetical protein
VGAGLGIGRGDVDVAAQHRQRWPVVAGSRLPIQVELVAELGVSGVLCCQPAIAESAGPFDGDFVGAGDPDLGWMSGSGEIVALRTSNERPCADTVSPANKARTTVIASSVRVPQELSV